MSTLRRVLPFAGLLAAELGAVGLLHALGDQAWAQVSVGQPRRWVSVTPPVDALMAALRLIGLGVGWWLLATTTTTAMAAGLRAERLAGLVRPLTWSVARRAADRAVATGLSVALLAPSVPVLADEAGPPPPALSEPAAVEPAPHDARAVDDRESAEGHAGGRQPVAGGEKPGERGETPRVHEVAPGEHLWAIAADALAAHRGVAPAELPDREVAAHWREVIEANAGRLRSGDPDLVFPGEQLRLPPPPP